jgi:hypothetical protein
VGVHLSTLLGQKLGRGYEDSLLSSTSIGVLAAILATAFVGAERLAGVAALAWTASRMPDLVAHNPTFNGIRCHSRPVRVLHRADPRNRPPGARLATMIYLVDGKLAAKTHAASSHTTQSAAQRSSERRRRRPALPQRPGEAEVRRAAPRPARCVPFRALERFGRTSEPAVL